MSTFPTVIDTFTTHANGDVIQPAYDNAQQVALVAIETKLGTTGSADSTTVDYKLSGVTGSDKAVSKTGAETVTNKTLTSSTVNGVTLSTSAGAGNFLQGDGNYGTLSIADGSYSTKGKLQGLTDAATSGLTIASGVISVNSGTGNNQIVKLNGSAQLPAVDGSLLTNATSYVGAVTTKSSVTTENVDTVFTCNFTAKNITIYYRLHGKNAGTEQYSYGIAVWNGTTLTSNMWLKKNLATDTLSTSVPTLDAASPTAGTVAGSYATVTLSITAVSSTTFTVRSAHVTGDSSGSDSNYYVVATR